MIDRPVTRSILIILSEIGKPKLTNLDVLIADNQIRLQSPQVKFLEQQLELLQRHSLVYNDEGTHASRTEREFDPTPILRSRVIKPTNALEVGLIGIESLVIRVPVACMQVQDLALLSRVDNTDLDVFVFVLEHLHLVLRLDELLDQPQKLPQRYPPMYEDVDDHAALAESEDEFGTVFCSCCVVAPQTPEVGLACVEALPVAISTDWVVHWLMF